MTSSRERGRTVRDLAFEVMRDHGLTTVFANPGSTEVPFRGGLPDDMRFVLGLHEGSVVGMATGWAIARRKAAFVLVHTTAGLGNAVAARGTARVNRAPLVVLVGQQDRRHLAQEPFLAGRLEGLAGDYPVSVGQPVRAQDVPGALARARHEAEHAGGPALVIVPMDDWLAHAPARHEIAAPARTLRGRPPDSEAVDRIAALLEEARAPALVVGAGADSPEAWAAVVALAEKLGCPVWQEAFGARAGFPQDHPQFAGHLPFDRARLRDVLADRDAVLAVGAPVPRPAAGARGTASGRARAERAGRAADARRSRDRGGPFKPSGAPGAPAGAPTARLPQRRRGRTRVRPPGGDRRSHGPFRQARRSGGRRRGLDVCHPVAVERRALPGRGAVRGPGERRVRRHGPARRPAGPGRAMAGVRGDRHRGDGARAGMSGAALGTSRRAGRRARRGGAAARGAGRAVAARGDGRAGRRLQPIDTDRPPVKRRVAP